MPITHFWPHDLNGCFAEVHPANRFLSEILYFSFDLITTSSNKQTAHLRMCLSLTSLFCEIVNKQSIHCCCFFKTIFSSQFEDSSSKLQCLPYLLFKKQHCKRKFAYISINAWLSWPANKEQGNEASRHGLMSPSTFRQQTLSLESCTSQNCFPLKSNKPSFLCSSFKIGCYCSCLNYGSL